MCLIHDEQGQTERKRELGREVRENERGKEGERERQTGREVPRTHTHTHRGRTKVV